MCRYDELMKWTFIKGAVQKPGLSVQWGGQDNYEVVRKVGRGKYSEVFEVGPPCKLPAVTVGPCMEVTCVGALHLGRLHSQQPEVYHQDTEAGQEEEDSERDKDPPEHLQWPQHHQALRRCQGS